MMESKSGLQTGAAARHGAIFVIMAQPFRWSGTADDVPPGTPSPFSVDNFVGNQVGNRRQAAQILTSNTLMSKQAVQNALKSRAWLRVPRMGRFCGGFASLAAACGHICPANASV
jgi:hypothetical protein